MTMTDNAGALALAATPRDNGGLLRMLEQIANEGWDGRMGRRPTAASTSTLCQVRKPRANPGQPRNVDDVLRRTLTTPPSPRAQTV